MLSHAAGGIRASTAVGGKEYFVTEDSVGTMHDPVDTLWVTDGTTAGTTAFATLPANTQVSGTSPDGQWLAAAGGKVYFAGSDLSGTELWASDGTAAGTKRLKDINPFAQEQFGGSPDIPPYPRSSSPQQFATIGGTVYFAADDGVHGQELWKTDGTEAGTVMVKDLSPTVGGPRFELSGTPSGSRLSGLTAFGGRLYFAADDGSTGPQLYASDGTAAGTVKLTAAVHSANAGGGGLTGGEAPAVIAALGGKLLFGFGDAAHGRQLWATDGTADGTAAVTAIGTPTSGWDRLFGGPLPVGLVGGKLLFSADDGTAGRQLGATDGTAAGTKSLDRLNPTDLGSDPRSFLALGSRVLFAATDGHGAYGVFATDGTAAPALVKRFDAGTDPTVSVRPGPLLRSGGLAYFTLNAGSNGQQLWATDGTAAGTKLVEQVNANSSRDPNIGEPTTGPIRDLTANGGKLFFAADTDAISGQVWVSDGTAAGTKVVKALGAPATPTNPYPPAGANPVVVAVVGDRVLFAADDGVHGRELWVTDGTDAGTKLAADLNPGAGSGLGGDPTSGFGPATAPTAAVANGRLVLAGFSPAQSPEPWAVPLADLGIVSPPPVVPPTPPAGAGVVAAFGVSTPAGVAFRGNLATVTLPAGASYAATISWGDGSTSAGTLTRLTATGKAYTISGSHTYAAPGSRPLSVVVTANGHAVLTAHATAAVSDARFYVGRVAQRVRVGPPFTGTVATIQGLNPADGKASDYTATIDWGDGHPTAGTVRRVSAGRYEVVGSHAFATPGRRAATVTLTSAVTGKVATAASAFLVDAARPTAGVSRT